MKQSYLRLLKMIIPCGMIFCVNVFALDFKCNLSGLENLIDKSEGWFSYLTDKLYSRPPLNSEMNTFRDSLNSETSRQDVATGAYETDEYYGRLIDSFYTTYLKRPADAGGRNYWISILKKLVDERTVITGFVTSTEYINNNGGLTRPFLDSIYRDLLGRTIDPVGLSVFTGWINNDKVNGPSRVVKAILYSDEYAKLILNKQLKFFYNRTATGQETTAWLSTLKDKYKLGIKLLNLTLISSNEAVSQPQNYASNRISNCIAGAALNDKILLYPAGSDYLIDTQININRSDITLGSDGLDITSSTCDPNVRVCARLKATPDFDTSYGLIAVTNAQSNITIQNLIIDGDKQNRINTGVNNPSKKLCEDSWTGYNMFFAITSNFTFINNASINALCGTGLALHGEPGFIPKDILISNNLFADNGSQACYRVSDGLTIGNPDNAEVTFNTFRNNTDVHLILGGCTHCNVSGNLIEQTGGGAYAGLMVQAWPNNATTGDYSYSNFTGNSIRAYPSPSTIGNIESCTAPPTSTIGNIGIGFYIGDLAWYNAPVSGGTDSTGKVPNSTVSNNTIVDTLAGLAIDNAKNFIVSDNTVIKTLPPGTINTSCYGYDPATFTYSLSSTTTSNISLLNNYQGNDFSSLIPAQFIDFTFRFGCIPNTWW